MTDDTIETGGLECRERKAAQTGGDFTDFSNTQKKKSGLSRGLGKGFHLVCVPNKLGCPWGVKKFIQSGLCPRLKKKPFRLIHLVRTKDQSGLCLELKKKPFRLIHLVRTKDQSGLCLGLKKETI